MDSTRPWPSGRFHPLGCEFLVEVGFGHLVACYRREVRRGIAVGAVLALLILAAMSYVRVGWTRMEHDCAADPRGSSFSGSTVSYSWSWSPVGFRCTFDDGSRRTSLWF